MEEMNMKKTVALLLSLVFLCLNVCTAFAAEPVKSDGITSATPKSYTSTYIVYEDGSCVLVGDENTVSPRNLQPRGTITLTYEITSWTGSTIRHAVKVSATGADIMGMEGLFYVTPGGEQYVSYSTDHASGFFYGLDSVNVGNATSVEAGYQDVYFHTTYGTVIAPDAVHTFYKSDF